MRVRADYEHHATIEMVRRDKRDEFLLVGTAEQIGAEIARMSQSSLENYGGVSIRVSTISPMNVVKLSTV